MIIYPSTKIRPYVYICFNKVTGEFYIGYREENVRLNRLSHIDLPKYCTSSKVVNPIFDNFDWFILAEFEAGADAYDFEQQLIFENWNNPLLLNENCHYRKAKFRHPNGAWNKGIKTGPQSSELIKKRTAKQKGTKKGTWSKERKAEKSAATKGISKSKESVAKRTISMLGKNKGRKLGPHSEERKLKTRIGKIQAQNIRNAALGEA